MDSRTHHINKYYYYLLLIFVWYGFLAITFVLLSLTAIGLFILAGADTIPGFVMLSALVLSVIISIPLLKIIFKKLKIQTTTQKNILKISFPERVSKKINNSSYAERIFISIVEWAIYVVVFGFLFGVISSPIFKYFDIDRIYFDMTSLPIMIAVFLYLFYKNERFASVFQEKELKYRITNIIVILILLIYAFYPLILKVFALLG